MCWWYWKSSRSLCWALSCLDLLTQQMSVAISHLTSGVVVVDFFVVEIRALTPGLTWIKFPGSPMDRRESRCPINPLAFPVSSHTSVTVASSTSPDSPVSFDLSQTMASMTISADPTHLLESAVPDLSDAMSSRVDTVWFFPISLRNEWSEFVCHNLDNCASATEKLGSPVHAPLMYQKLNWSNGFERLYRANEQKR